MIYEPFLRQVADYYVEAGVELLKERTFVFPSKRACTFFLRYLSDIVKEQNKVILAPRCTTINEFILGLMPTMKPLDRTELLFKLYDCYCVVSGRGGEVESFDSFLFWGDIILKDFDLIDRYLVDARQLYRNLSAVKEIEDPDEYISDELKSVIATYWQSFSERKGEYREKFLAFWESLGDLYYLFSQQCEDERVSYEGYIYRKVAEDVAKDFSKELGTYSEIIEGLVSRSASILEQGISPYVFVGLFDISTSERKLMRVMHRRHLAEFVWDESNCVAQDKEHGAYRLLSRNKEQLSAVDYTRGVHSEESFAYLPQSIKVYKCSSTMTQMKALPQIISSLYQAEEPDTNHIDTAIILPDEQLLIPTVSAIPEHYTDLNITLGYPLNKTNISLLLNRWMRFLLSEVNGAYPVPELINLLSLQLFVKHYPGLTIIADMLREQKNYMLGAAWILDKFVPARLERATRRGGEIKYSQEDRLAVEHALPLAKKLLLIRPEGSREDLHKAKGFLRVMKAILEQVATPLKSAVEQETEVLGEATRIGGIRIGFELTFLMHYGKLINRLESLIEDYGREDFSREGVIHLLDGLTNGYTIPFKGDPLKGLQVMGLLESRALHFDKLIYLAAQDGSLPRGKVGSTFIPYDLRRGFALPTPEDEDIAEAYRFYESISCTRHLVMVYSTSADAIGGKGECSRYISQLKMLYGAKIEELSVDVPAAGIKENETIVEKDEYVCRQLEQFLKREGKYGRYLSASSLNIYLQCPLRFYYEHVCQAREEGYVDELMQANEFGTIIHQVMERLYEPYIGRLVDETILRAYVDGEQREQLRTLVEQTYTEFYTKNVGNTFNISKGDELQIDTIYYYAINILRFDLTCVPFTYIASEAKMYLDIPLLLDGKEECVGFTGSIDRLDEVYSEEYGGMVRRVVDYKSGKDSNSGIASIEELFLNVYKNKAAIQLLLYSEMICAGQREEGKPMVCTDKPISPTLYAFRNIKEGYNSSLQRKGGESLRYSDVRDEYMAVVRQRLEDLFDRNKAFRPCVGEHCKYCPYSTICRATT